MSGGVVLVGLSGSGKSTVGTALASALRLPLVDTDRAIEREAGCTIAALFAKRGEDHFRSLETGVLLGACARRAVIATGGGAVLRAQNRAAMRERNLVVWLDPPAAALAQRLAAHERGEARPLLAGDTVARLRELYEQRHDLYAEVAHVHVTGDRALGDAGDLASYLATVYGQWYGKEATE